MSGKPETTIIQCRDCDAPATTEDIWGHITTPLCDECYRQRQELKEWLAND